LTQAILISIRMEIPNAGDVVVQELAPLYKARRVFSRSLPLLMKQSSRPFLKRYLRRDETLRDISDCDSSLRDALGLFGVSFCEYFQKGPMLGFLYRSQSRSIHLNKFRNLKNISTPCDRATYRSGPLRPFFLFLPATNVSYKVPKCL